MFLPKIEVYNLLKELNYDVMQNSQNVFNSFPTITFEILDNNISLFLDNSISYQDITVKIDIWSESSVEASEILKKVELKMREEHYRMIFSGDIPNVDKSIFHVSTKFIKKI